jgi:hypothetical protein
VHRAALYVMRILVWGAGLLIILYVIFMNTTPFDTVRIVTDQDKEFTTIGPASRIEKSDGFTSLLDDPTYFSIKAMVPFDNAVAKIIFKNSDEHEFSVGFKDQESWHYDKQILDSPLMNSLEWERVGDGPYLYQKTPAYSSPNELLENPPLDKTIGLYDFDSSILANEVTSVEDYKPSKETTIINTPIRGSAVMYAYLKDEMFDMTFTKRDLNWYAEPDVTNIKIYKHQDIVFEATIDDDGNASENKSIGAAQSVQIRNPGPELPEQGIYKIVIDSSSDSAVTSISTNLHKLVFEGPLFLINNREVYGTLASKTTPTVLTTNANKVSIITAHGQALQTVTDGVQDVMIDEVRQTYYLESSALQTTLTFPKSDITVNGIGNFSFNSEQFFKPSRYKLLSLQSPEDFDNVDYVLTNYRKPENVGDGWKQTERTFLLKTAIIEKGKLSWLLSAPGLKEFNGSVDVKSFEMSLYREGWWGKQ